MNNFAKTLRKDLTLPEKVLWYHLRNRSFLGYKFRRQVQIDNYIADFVCFETRLIIELDGRQHLTDENIIYDQKRTEYLQGQNFRVIRFFNNDILNNINSVLEKLKIELENTPSSGLRPASPASGEAIYILSPLAGENIRRLGEEYNPKQELRKWAKEERKKLDMEPLSIDLVRNLKDTKEYQQAKNIMIFYPKENEVNLLSLMTDESKNFYLPKIDGEDLLCCPYNDGDELCVSCFKTQEPKSEPVQNSILDLIVVPALAVDTEGYRLGYGGGFYDRFLKGINAKKLVCIPKEFVIETVFPEKHDIKIDRIMTV